MRVPLVHNCPFFLAFFLKSKYKGPKGTYVLYDIDANIFRLILTYLSFGTVYIYIYIILFILDIYN